MPYNMSYIEKNRKIWQYFIDTADKCVRMRNLSRYAYKDFKNAAVFLLKDRFNMIHYYIFVLFKVSDGPRAAIFPAKGDRVSTDTCILSTFDPLSRVMADKLLKLYPIEGSENINF